MRRGDLSDLAGEDDAWGQEALPSQPITPEASADYYRRRAAELEDPPDGCDWCGTGPFTGHRGCTNEPLPPAEQERYWQRYHAARAWALVDDPAA